MNTNDMTIEELEAELERRKSAAKSKPAEVTLYTHGDSSALFYQAQEEHGMEGYEAEKFANTLYEVAFHGQVVPATGEVDIQSIDIGDGKGHFYRSNHDADRYAFVLSRRDEIGPNQTSTMLVVAEDETEARRLSMDKWGDWEYYALQLEVVRVGPTDLSKGFIFCHSTGDY